MQYIFYRYASRTIVVHLSTYFLKLQEYHTSRNNSGASQQRRQDELTMTSNTLNANVGIQEKAPSATSVIDNKHVTYRGNSSHSAIEEWINYLPNVKWRNVAVISFVHLCALYSLVTIDFTMNIKTVFWYILICVIQGMGFTAGAHRYWTHRTFKAKLPLRIILVFCYLTAGQISIRNWVRDHRTHHKFTETNADPYNSNRGFFFSHVGWLMVKKHPEVIKKGQQMDISDIKADSFVMFADKHLFILNLICGLLIPVMVPVYGWNETWTMSMKLHFFRHIFGWHTVWSVNSFAHMWGSRPYDMHIKPTNNVMVSFASFGEGSHNYHHVFPWDYKASEFGIHTYNFTAMFIEFFAKIGWAYDLQEPSPELVKSVAIKNKMAERHYKWDAVPPPNGEGKIYS
ncbi:acyl-CoA Delta(11) desaturase isoform X2 [Harpegnathos saltator]|uniref:acyl-CoA Delta(11) desaturase isoform X2 n=1 Tax=Harpegnathos saltator TaxID=610380 RepID=UPI000DBEEFB9|nr:acyl-CoA Delta(11) desaturase isoform X2 [Harpegnathos saltator]